MSEGLIARLLDQADCEGWPRYIRDLFRAAAEDLKYSRTALRRIADGLDDCQCEHDDENCCARIADYCCPFCIATVALLGEPEATNAVDPSAQPRESRPRASEDSSDLSAAASLREPPQEPWQPIATYGTRCDYVLLNSSAHGRVIGAHVTGDVWHLVGVGAVSSESERPTHWMPLPSPPASAPAPQTHLTRFEVIDESGRAFSRWDCHVELSYQDDGRTLKVFVGAAAPAPKEEA